MSTLARYKKITVTNVYMFIIILMGTSLFVLHDIYIPNHNTFEWALFLLLSTAVVLLNQYRIALPLNKNSLTMDTSIFLAILYIYGLEMAIAILIVGSLVYALFLFNRVNTPWFHLFNCTMLIITITGTYYVFILSGGETGSINLVNYLPYLLSLVTYFSINVIIISIYYFLYKKSSSAWIFFRIINELGKEAILNYSITLALAFILAMLLEMNQIFGIIIFTVVIILSSLSFLKYFHLYEQMTKEKNNKEQILNSLPVGIITVDSRTSEFFLNSTANSLLDTDETKIKQLTAKDQIKNKQFWDIFSSERKCQNIKVSYTSNNESYVLLVSQSQLYDQHQSLIGRIFFFIDITDTSELELRMYQTEKLALLGELAAGAAHEIRNPLTVVQGFLTLMEQNLSIQEQNKFYLSLMLSEFNRINVIIEEMLMIAKPGAPKFKDMKISDIIIETADFYSNSTSEQQLKFNFNLDDTTLILDQMQIKQVLHNLIRNSSDAVNGKGTISIYSKIQKDYYHLYIQDTGMGIPQYIQKEIFNPFTTSKETGTGLGLTIVQRIIESHNGQIKLLSSSEEGTTFVISFPLPIYT